MLSQAACGHLFFPLTGHDAIGSVTSQTNKANLWVWIQTHTETKQSPLREETRLYRQKTNLGLFTSFIRFNFRSNSSPRYKGHRDQGPMDPSLPLIAIPSRICPADVLTHSKDPPYVIRLSTAEVNEPF